ncbi:MAG: flippase [bacterium]
MSALSLTYIKEKWAHAGFQKYFQNMSWIFGARILSILISLVATSVIARGLGPSNYGELSYATSFVGLFSFLYSLGIDGILYRELINRPDKKRELLGSAFAIKIATGILTALVIIVSAFFLSVHDISFVLILVLSSTFILNSLQIINYEFQSRVESKYPAIAAIIIAVILNALKILVIASGKGVLYLALILVLEPILYGAFYWYIYEKQIGEKISNWKFDRQISLSLIRDSWPLIFTGIFAMIYARIDQIFIKHMINSASVGIYDSAVRLTEVWYLIPNIIVSAFFPAIINAKNTSKALYQSRLSRLTKLLILLSVFIALPISLLAPMIINILYGAKFILAAGILQIYIWSIVGTFLINLATQYLIAENKKKSLVLLNVIPMIVNVVLNIIWIPLYGITGAAYATLISYSLGPIYMLFSNYFTSRIPQTNE